MNYKNQILRELNGDPKKYLELIRELSKDDESQIQVNNDLEWLEDSKFIKSVFPESNIGNPKYQMTDSGNEYFNHYFKYWWTNNWKYVVSSLVSILLAIIGLIAAA